MNKLKLYFIFLQLIIIYSEEILPKNRFLDHIGKGIPNFFKRIFGHSKSINCYYPDYKVLNFHSTYKVRKCLKNYNVKECVKLNQNAIKYSCDNYNTIKNNFDYLKYSIYKGKIAACVIQDDERRFPIEYQCTNKYVCEDISEYIKCI